MDTLDDVLMYCPGINWTTAAPGVAQPIVVCRLRTALELGRVLFHENSRAASPQTGHKKTMAAPPLNLLSSYFLDTTLAYGLVRAELQFA
jgi:hypothetical protein